MNTSIPKFLGAIDVEIELVAKVTLRDIANQKQYCCKTPVTIDLVKQALEPLGYTVVATDAVDVKWVDWSSEEDGFYTAKFQDYRLNIWEQEDDWYWGVSMSGPRVFLGGDPCELFQQALAAATEALSNHLSDTRPTTPLA